MSGRGIALAFFACGAGWLFAIGFALGVTGSGGAGCMFGAALCALIAMLIGRNT